MMAPTFDELQKNLGLTTEYLNADQLDDLKNWCRSNVSAVLEFTGKPEDVYLKYFEVAKAYLDNFIVWKPEDNTKVLAEFEDMNAIQRAAYKGYDVFLDSLKLPTADAFNLENEYGMTPLHLAALKGHLNTIKLLLSKGAQPIYANKSGQFPVYSALVMAISDTPELKKKKCEIFNLLIEKEDFLSAVDLSGETIMHLMALNGFDNLIKEVLKHRSQLAFNCNHRSRYPIHVAILNKQVNAVKELLQVEGMSEVTDENNRNPLHYAAMYSGLPIIKECIAASKNIDARDTFARTALLLAAESGNLPAVQELIKNKACIDVVDLSGQNILHLAVQSQNYNLVKWILLNTNIDVNSKDENDHTPLYYAVNKEQQKVPNSKIEQLLAGKGGTNSSANGLFQ
ncbi:MAG: ankyrin repeat domain-containing protein [Legionella sp.]|jgi:ankyrin repeat protein